MNGRFALMPVLCASLLLAGQALGQQTQTPASTQTPTATPALKISTEATPVTIYATARDKHDKIVADLKAEDFVLEEDGQPQTIRSVARAADAPLTVGLLVDTSERQRRALESERTASYTFLDHTLREDKDKAFLIHFDSEVELLRDLTSSRPKLQAALQELQTAQPQAAGDDDDSGEARRGGAQLYDAIYLASNELMKKQQGRKVLFILSDGVDRHSKESLDDAIEAAQRADTAVYSIYFIDEGHEHEGGSGRRGGWGVGAGGPVGWPGAGGPGYPGGGQGGPGGGGRRRSEPRIDGKGILAQISTETGGRMIEVSKKLTLDQAYAQVEEELRNQYGLAYTPAPADSGAGYHKVHLAAKDSDITVHAREGYYTGR